MTQAALRQGAERTCPSSGALISVLCADPKAPREVLTGALQNRFKTLVAGFGCFQIREVRERISIRYRCAQDD